MANGKMVTEKADKWYNNPSNNFRLGIGEKETRRAYLDMNIDVDSLTDEFKMIIEVPNSDGTKTSFIYLIPEQ